jgi:aldehyde dehydrogenase (NAD+)
VFDDAEFDHAVDIAIRGSFINCGQNCISAERLYIQQGIYDKFVQEVSRKLSALQVGVSSCSPDSTRCDFGAITMGAQVSHYETLIADAVSKGAQLVAGGKTKKVEGSEGVFFEPTILSHVTHEMRIANEEAFGPIMLLFKFTSEEEVIKMANCTEFGLGSCVFTTDYKKAERVTGQLVTGMTSVNDFGMVPMVQSLPFGGIKSSGFGAFNGREGLIGFSRTHAVVTDRFPMRTQTPKFLAYPAGKNAWRIVRQAVRMIYGPSWVESAKSLVRMVQEIIKA